MDQRERLDFALDATGTGLWTYDPPKAVFQFCTRACVMLGFQLAEISLGDALGLFEPADAVRFQQLIDAAADGCADHEIECHLHRADTGADRWVALRARPDTTAGGVIGTVRDVTEVRRYDAQVHMLMREVTHRSKNLLAIIQAMARQTVKDSLSAVEFEERFSARLRGLSFSHELLASQDWRGASLTELAEGHLSHLRERHGDRVQIAGPVVFIRPEAAQNIGLALNELSSNAQQFGALSGETGVVRLEWSIDADEKGPHALAMVWSETGAPTAIRPPLRQGFGHRVMERVVARALDGTAKMTFAPTGLRWSLKIPLTHIASEAAA